ncbi:CBS domain-containing protein [Zobellella denitrificans]|jgi:acetoin utilization protein AcuB|uniref:Signal transduction protein n=1 Tax=Zobellella denitrificans TaxID=347534 RepID=A0A231MZ43_9GAMM|nr:CBS domain-containing protein [Zobellella denitrificans]ATG72647.1 signal transduction protein [Zobellella denitrificans]OXS15477.1 CBS domain-containing protein [Zobellella denitrificans]
MQVQDIMTRRIATVHQDDRLEMVRAIFDQAPFRHLLVVDDEDRLCGVITHADMYRALSPYLATDAELERDRDTLQRRAHQVMSRNPVTIAPETGLDTAAALLLEHQISCLPVVAEDRLQGVISWKDLLRTLLK